MERLLEILTSSEAVVAVISVVVGAITTSVVQFVASGLRSPMIYLREKLATDRALLIRLIVTVILFVYFFEVGYILSAPLLFYALTFAALLANLAIAEVTGGLSERELPVVAPPLGTVGLPLSPTPYESIQRALAHLHSEVERMLKGQFLPHFEHAFWVRCNVMVHRDKQLPIAVHHNMDSAEDTDRDLLLEDSQGVAGHAFKLRRCQSGNHKEPPRDKGPSWLLHPEQVELVRKDLGHIWACPIRPRGGAPIGVLNVDTNLVVETALAHDIMRFTREFADIVYLVLRSSMGSNAEPGESH